MRRTRAALTAAFGTLLLISAVPLTAVPAAAGTRHTSVVADRPVRAVPQVLDGVVKSIAQVGDVMVAGGEFTRVSGPGGGTAETRHNIFAFDRATGELLPFAPEIDGMVVSVAAGPGSTVVAGGGFRRVNGEDRRGLTRLSLRDGEAADGFGAVADDGSVNRLETHGGALYVGGSFTGISGTPRTGLARLDARTGAVDPAFDITIAEQRRGRLRVGELAVSPDGRRLVIAGTFTKVEGERRYQIAAIDTGAGAARLSSWSTESYAAPCDYSNIHTYVRQIDFAPDGSYFAVATSGGPELKPGLCKTVARWENDDTRDTRPSWVNHSGGDSLYSVEATGAAVYVGGHQRWMDNPEGDRDKGPGAVERSGIAALDPATGSALAWNPGRDRGHGAEALTSTADGLYVGSDTERLAGERHPRLGFFPMR
ncbi:delta-60 repeat domain-containing protein [Nocardiopsis mangrovi]|uniref:Delta-60 repeat domain-containing protein n=1 Tax=Nocardiopsis mangrovi TaxID=1179818 RepID=A0ABV9E289_9ACTN